jgi:hypothetical protein
MATSRSRLDWLTLFETVIEKPHAEMNEHWRVLLKDLHLQPTHYLALVETLRQGRWRKADNPKAYVKRVTLIEASKMEAAEQDSAMLFLPDGPEEDEGGGGISSLLDRTSFADSFSQPLRSSDGVWRATDQYGWYSDSGHEEDDEGRPIENYRESLFAKIPGTLKSRQEPTTTEIALWEIVNSRTTEHHHHVKPHVHVDWKEWGKQAGLSKWEIKVLQYRALGVSQEAALAKQPNEISRKALQAAWRKFDRTGKDRLMASAKKVREQMSRNKRNPTLDK